MTVAASDIKFRKSVSQTDTDANGGRKGTTLVVSGARHSLFPRVTKSQRESGIVRYRKEFYCNENADDQSAYGVLIYLMRPSTANDQFYLAEGTQRDTQASFKRRTAVDAYATSRFDRIWTGCGQLQSDITAGDSTLTLIMEDSDFQFPNGGYLYLSNNTKTGQTIDSDVVVGDSVTYSSGSWSKIAHTDDITYPNGWCVGSGEVLTKDTDTNEEFLLLAENHYTGEVIGTGDGSTANPALSTLTNVTNGICRQPDKLPVITATCGSTTRTVYINADGTVDTATSYASGGELNMSTGVWSTDITWTTAPDNGTDITADYRERCYNYATGNEATISLDEQVANGYTATVTYGSGCIYADEVACSTDWIDDANVSVAGTGTYDDTSYPLSMFNDGTVEETWTLEFTGASSFKITGAYYGEIVTSANGSTLSNCRPSNPDGTYYFEISSAGWSGTFQSGDTIQFSTSPSAIPVLLEEMVSAATAQEPNNLLPIGSYTE